MTMPGVNPKKRHGKDCEMGRGRLQPHQPGAYDRYVRGGAFDVNRAIGDLVGTMFDPIIVWKGMESPELIPKWLKDKITLDRMIEEQRPQPTGTDSEALAFLMTASLAVPPTQLLHDLYIYLFEKEMKKFGNEMPGDSPKIDKLRLDQEAELARLKRWIYQQRLENRKLRQRKSNPIRRVPGGWQWGHHGKVYPERWRAVRQAAAAHAHGFRENPTSDALTQRLADKAMALSDGDVEGTVEWLISLGCKVVAASDPGVYNVEGLVGIRAGIYGGMDPVTAAVQLGFLLAGMYWPTVYPKLLKEVNRRWKERHTRVWHRGPLLQ